MKQVQKPKGGRGSTNIAIAGNVNMSGLTYDEMKSIAHDVARFELEKFAEKAKLTANNRADEILISYYQR